MPDAAPGRADQTNGGFMPNSIVQFITSKGDIKLEVLEDKTR